MKKISRTVQTNVRENGVQKKAALVGLSRLETCGSRLLTGTAAMPALLIHQKGSIINIPLYF